MHISWRWRDGTKKESEFEWSDVLSVAVFKRDCFSVDQICVAFGLAEEAIEIDEHIDGWNDLVGSLPDYLVGCQRFEEWFGPVAQPPFETNWTKIFERSNSDPSTDLGRIRTGP